MTIDGLCKSCAAFITLSCPLITTLRAMNHEQGLGFIVFGKVVENDY